MLELKLLLPHDGSGYIGGNLGASPRGRAAPPQLPPVFSSLSPISGKGMSGKAATGLRRKKYLGCRSSKRLKFIFTSTPHFLATFPSPIFEIKVNWTYTC